MTAKVWKTSPLLLKYPMPSLKYEVIEENKPTGYFPLPVGCTISGKDPKLAS